MNTRGRTGSREAAAHAAPLDAAVVRRWSARALREVGEVREELDAINVYPVADGDTGTNLYLTLESADQAVAASCAGAPSVAQALGALAHGALIGARGNSGTILAQLLRGLAQHYTEHHARVAGADAPTGGEEPRPSPPGVLFAEALRHAVRSAYEAVARPVEGTMLTVAAAAADAARAALDGGRPVAPEDDAHGSGGPGASGEPGVGDVAGDLAAVVRAACRGARQALARTPEQLGELARAGVVDAGGSGLVTVLEALAATLDGGDVAGEGAGHAAGDGARVAVGGEPTGVRRSPHRRAPSGAPDRDGPSPEPGYEVIYLLEAEDAAVRRLRERLDALGDSLVVVGGDGLWQVHVHTTDAGAAVEEGVRAGRPHRIRITSLRVEGVADRGRDTVADCCPPPAEPAGAADASTERRLVLAVVPGSGLAEVCTGAGALAVTTSPEEPLASGELAAAVRRQGAREVVLLPNDPALHHTGAAAVEQLRGEGLRAALIPTRSPVQGLAALAVHQPERRFDEDVVAMTAAAGATRWAELTVAPTRSWTTVGVCEAGDVLGLVEGDVAVIGREPADTAVAVLDRMLAAGGELVTLVLGRGVPDGLAERLADHVRRHHLAVDTAVYRGEQRAPLLIGVE